MTKSEFVALIEAAQLGALDSEGETIGDTLSPIRDWFASLCGVDCEIPADLADALAEALRRLNAVYSDDGYAVDGPAALAEQNAVADVLDRVAGRLGYISIEPNGGCEWLVRIYTAAEPLGADRSYGSYEFGDIDEYGQWVGDEDELLPTLLADTSAIGEGDAHMAVYIDGRRVREACAVAALQKMTKDEIVAAATRLCCGELRQVYAEFASAAGVDLTTGRLVSPQFRPSKIHYRAAQRALRRALEMRGVPAADGLLDPEQFCPRVAGLAALRQ